MKDEFQTLHDNHIFELVKLPKGKRVLKKSVSLQVEVKREFNFTI